MAQSKKSEGLCERIRSAVSPFSRPRTRRTVNKNPIEISSKPVHVLHRSETVPVELGHAAAPDARASPQIAESGEREILIVRGHKFAKSVSRGEDLGHHLHFTKATSNKDDDHQHEGRFSDYIIKFKRKMIQTASSAGAAAANVGSGGGEAVDTVRRDSFNDKIGNYIDRARVKIRTTTNDGVDDQNPIKKIEK